MVTIQFSDLLDAFQFASVGGPYESSAFLDLDTGEIHYTSAEIGLDEEVPEDLETSDRYRALPNRNDLDLGRNLALAFVKQALPADYDNAALSFRSKGAYSRFKDLLASRGALEEWYKFEAHATEAALREWCSENGIELSHAPSGT